MRKLWLLLLSCITCSFVLISCKKNAVEEIYTPVVNPVIPDFTTKINAGVNGFVTDENGNAAAGVVIKAGDFSAATDMYGYFKISNGAFAKSAGFIEISKAGYFTSYKTFLPQQDKEAFIRLQLVPKKNIGSINAAAGGIVTTADGAKITLLPDAVVTAATNTAYTGNINIAAHWFNPAEEEKTNLAMPGDLRGIDSAGHLKALVTYGMMAVELTGSNGELLQLSNGKKATLNFPIPASINAVAPAVVPLWYFDETKGLWKQEGNAVKNGSEYSGQVSHFSFWNCDAPYPLVNFTAQLVDENLHVLKGISTKISIENNSVPGSARYSCTDSNGIVYGMVPANASLSFEAINNCGESIVLKTFVTSTSNIDLGSLKLNSVAAMGVITGTVQKCNGLPVTSGRVMIIGTGLNNVTSINADGSFLYAGFVCPGTDAAVVATDNETGQQSIPHSFVTTAGNNETGVLNACSAAETESIIYSLDGKVTSLTLPLSIFEGGPQLIDTVNYTYIRANDLISGEGIFSLTAIAPAVPGTYRFDTVNAVIQLKSTNPSEIVAYHFTNSTVLTISEYGLIGQFIKGTIDGAVQRNGEGNPPVLPFTCSFNIKRDL
ncbi:MAG: hypothetical protein QM791_21130 [Ferruginibacter sp.]